ncbi:MAG: lysophospholipid acyltransferase family protein [candidate division WOR-3 bacterium]
MSRIRTGMDKSRVWWRIVKSVLLKIYGLLVRVRVFGREKIALPMRTGFIVAANHLTGADSIVLQIGLRTRIFFLAWARWFHSRFVGFWMRNLCDTMPVIKGPDPDNLATLRRSIEMLKQGATIGVFPEGELNRTGQVRHLYDGTAWLAVRAGVPIVPVYVTGLKPGPEPYSRPWLNEAWEGFFSVVGNLLNRSIIVAVGEPIFPNPEPPPSGAELREEIERINRLLLFQFQEMERRFKRRGPVFDHRQN